MNYYFICLEFIILGKHESINAVGLGENLRSVRSLAFIFFW